MAKNDFVANIRERDFPPVMVATYRRLQKIYGNAAQKARLRADLSTNHRMDTDLTDVHVGLASIAQFIPQNYILPPNTPDDLLHNQDPELFAPGETLASLAAEFSLAHELGHLTVHPTGSAGGITSFGKLATKLPVESEDAMKWMNVISDLIVNHNTYTATNVVTGKKARSRQNERMMLGHTITSTMREATIPTRAPVQGAGGRTTMAEVDLALVQHGKILRDGVDAFGHPVVDNRYQPTAPCTAETTNSNGVTVICPYHADGPNPRVHDRGCYDNHRLNGDSPTTNWTTSAGKRVLVRTEDAEWRGNTQQFTDEPPNTTPFYQRFQGQGRGQQFYPSIAYTLAPQSSQYGFFPSDRLITIREEAPGGGRVTTLDIYNCPSSPETAVGNDNWVVAFMEQESLDPSMPMCPGVTFERASPLYGSTDCKTASIPIRDSAGKKIQYEVGDVKTFDSRSAKAGSMIWEAHEPEALYYLPAVKMWVPIRYVEYVDPQTGSQCMNIWTNWFGWGEFQPMARYDDREAYWRFLGLQLIAYQYASQYSVLIDGVIRNYNSIPTDGTTAGKYFMKYIGRDMHRAMEGY